jgi:hypothetical protein
MSCNFYVARFKRNCQRNITDVLIYNNLQYCTLHYKIVNTETKSDKQETKSDKQETKLDKQEQQDEPDNEAKPDKETETKQDKDNKAKQDKNEINRCIYKMKSDKNCNKKCNIIYNVEYYCETHYNKILSLKKKEILLKIKKIETQKINKDNKNTIKKDIFNLLREIHPDKCKIPNFNSHENTQKLTKVLEKLKL